jgi:hypothetical protein
VTAPLALVTTALEPLAASVCDAGRPWLVLIAAPPRAPRPSTVAPANRSFVDRSTHSAPGSARHRESPDQEKVKEHQRLAVCPRRRERRHSRWEADAS